MLLYTYIYICNYSVANNACDKAWLKHRQWHDLSMKSGTYIYIMIYYIP